MNILSVNLNTINLYNNFNEDDPDIGIIACISEDKKIKKRSKPY